MERACRGVADADGQNQDEGRDQNVAGLGEIDLVLDDVAHADRGDHTVEHKADAADGAAGHGGDDGRELRAEGEEHVHSFNVRCITPLDFFPSLLYLSQSTLSVEFI